MRGSHKLEIRHALLCFIDEHEDGKDIHCVYPIFLA